MTISRFHLDRVTDYVSTLPSFSGTLRFNPASTHNRLMEALCVAANLHNRDLIVSLTKTRSVTDSAADLDRIADRDDVDETTARSMRHLARGLRTYDATHAEVAR